MSKQAKTKPFATDETGEEMEAEYSIENEEAEENISNAEIEEILASIPEPEFLYFGVTRSGKYFHVCDDPDECKQIIRAYCDPYETFDIYELNMKNPNRSKQVC